MDKYILIFIVCFLTVLIITPFVIKLAHAVGATDKPNYRKVHQKIMPRLGGIAIFIGVIVGYFTAGLYSERITGIILGALIIVVLGVLDDIYELSAKWKFLGQLMAACIIVATGLKIEYVSIPFVLESFDIGVMSIPLTIFWIVGITNAINLIDGLDGLAAGISSIALATIMILAGVAGKELILILSLIVLASTLGFLYYNFHPAKIFMGDTGALFLGYCIAVFSLLGLYKSVTLFSLIIPIIILGVPVFDTAFAILRRLLNNQKISSPDKSHMHHRLIEMGLSHRNTVLVIYGFGIFFSLCAVFLTSATLLGAIIIMIMLTVFIHFIAELVGVVRNERHRPIMRFYKKLSGRENKESI